MPGGLEFFHGRRLPAMEKILSSVFSVSRAKRVVSKR